MAGKYSRDKGANYERRIVKALKDSGISARRTSINQTQDGSAEFGDITIELPDRSIKMEAKHHKRISTKDLWEWLKGNDMLTIKITGLEPPLVIMPLSEYIKLISQSS